MNDVYMPRRGKQFRRRALRLWLASGFAITLATERNELFVRDRFEKLSVVSALSMFRIRAKPQSAMCETVA